MWFTLFYLLVTATFLWTTCAALIHLKWCNRLGKTIDPPNATQHEHATGAIERCSVVIPARNEESRIEQTIRRLLVQSNIAIEVIVVDDRSNDRTDQILNQVAKQDDRVVVQRVNELPKGWLGKCHACHLGAMKAKYDWILFTDADCWLAPDLITRAIRSAERDQVDHVTLTPGIDGASLGTQAWHLAFLISLANWMSGVNLDRPKAYLGMGAFNLVRASTYRHSGGYESLRLTVLDDVRLGLILRRSGCRTRAYIGGNDVICYWGKSVFDMIKIMEKNYFAAVDFRLGVALIAGFVGLLFWSAALVGPLTGTVAGLVAGLALFTLCFPAYILSQRLGWSGFCALLTPLIFPFIFYALLRSACITTWQGGVRWRDSFYPLDELRKGSVR